MVLTTFKDSFNDLLKNGAFYFAIAVVILIIGTLLFLYFYNKKKNK